VEFALQVRGTSDEIVKYGYGSCATRTTEWFRTVLSTERAPYMNEKEVNCETK
jgi:hypothetical protein